MKTVLAFIALVAAVLVCGCTASAPSGPAASPQGVGAALTIPDLTGSWTGPMQGYDVRTGFTNYPNLTIVMTVTEQHGRVFAGNFTFTGSLTTAGSSSQSVSGFAGVIGSDNRTFSIAEEGGGYATGEVLGPDSLEMTYLQDGTEYSAAVDTFQKT
jgi:hypothetical protein